MKHTHKLWIALILAGIVGGMVGIALTELMHFIQHTAYGYGAGGGACFLSGRRGSNVV